MDPLAAELDDAVDSWRQRGWPRPDVLLVTGSALGIDLGKSQIPAMDLSSLVPFEVFAVEGHALAVELFEPLPGRTVLYLRGRLHCYQGFSPAQVVFPTRLACLLGARVVLLTNASGSLDPTLAPGTLVAIQDHLNLSGLNPLVGDLPASWGERFPALDDAYDPRLRELARRLADEHGIELPEGVYAWLLGPSYETPAEIRMLRTLGARLVGMSTVPEVLAARHMGARCAALSLVTNLAAGLSDRAPHHEEVVREGERAARPLGGLLRSLLTHPELLA